jgi:hypothetical protein
LWNDFAAFNTYVTRVQSVLQSGSPDNEVLLYWPFADVLDDAEGLMHQYQVEKAAWLLDSPFAKTALELEIEGYAFDFISDDQLLQTKAERGLLHTPGNQYKAIVVPATRRMPLRTLRHLRTLAEQGAIVVFESLPEDVPGYSDLENRRTQFKALLNAEAFKNSVAGEKLGKALAQHGVASEQMAEAGLHYVRRAHPSGHDYFIVNLGAKSVEGWIELGRRAHQAVLLDPLTGRAGVAAIKDSGEKKTLIFLQLASGESLLLRARDERGVFSGVDTWAYVRPAGEPSKVEGEWTLSFLQGGPKLPAAIQTSELKSWTQLGDEETQRFGGTARYRIEFDTPQASADEWMLDLGDVREAARVRLNGKEIASALSLPFRVRLGPLAQRRNVLEIDVTNFAANRIRDMDRRGVKWKLMKEIDIVNIQYQPFDASQWDIAPSGLLGPVTLIPMKRLRP